MLESLDGDDGEDRGTDIVSQVARLSISHDGEYAIAMVMVADQLSGSDGDDDIT